MINCAYDAIGHDEMKRFLYKDFIEVVSSIIEYAEETNNRSVSPEYKSFLCNFYAEALAGVLIDWLKHRDQLKREYVIAYISITLKYSLEGILLSKDIHNY